MSAETKLDSDDPDFVVVESYRAPETEPDPQLRDNQMAMVFPAPLSDRLLVAALQLLPRAFPEGWRTWALAARLGLLEFMNDCHYVFEYELDLVQKILALVRASYRRRDPREPRVMRAIVEIAAGKMVDLPRFGSSGGGGGLGILVIGMSGVGKSSLLDRLCKFLGAFGRIHRSLNGDPARWPQLGVVRVNIVDTLAGTLKAILTEANRQAGRELHHVPARATIPELTRRVRAALSMGWAPVLVLDEVQRLANLTPQVAKQILQVAIDLMSGIGLPVVLVGTERVRQLFLLHQAELSKFSNGGTRNVQPLAEFDEDTVNFIGFLKRYSVSLSELVYASGFDNRLWVHSMGVKRIMVEYMRCVFERHAMDESTVADASLLQSISDREMRDFEPVVSVLRKANLGMKLSFADLQQYEDFLDAALRKRRQSRAEFRVQAYWQNSKASGEVELMMSAQEFLLLRSRLREEEAAEQSGHDEDPEVEDIDAATQAALADASDESSPPKGAPTTSHTESKLRKGLAKAKQQVREQGQVVSLDSARRNRKGSDDAVDPSDIR